jgi:uncharacterized membrane protein
MDLDWEKLVKRYVWHDERTPYFTRVARLSAVQARYEVFAYCLFMAVLFGVLAVVGLSQRLPHAGAAVVPLYAFSVLCAAVLLGATRSRAAAVHCATAPLALLAYFAVWGFPPGLSALDHAVLIALPLAAFLYSLRLLAVVRAFPLL